MPEKSLNAPTTPKLLSEGDGKTLSFRSWKVSELKPNPHNARGHSENQVSQLMASIHEWGYTNPIVCDDEGVLLAGHGRLLALQNLGVEEVGVIVVTGWSELEKRRYVLADNKIALNSGWDEDVLALELRDLIGQGEDLAVTGFASSEMTDLFADENEEPITAPADEARGISSPALSVDNVTVHCTAECVDRFTDAFNRWTDQNDFAPGFISHALEKLSALKQFEEGDNA